MRGMVSPVPDIAARLTRLRTALRLSQADICRRIGVAPNRWNQYESGERRITVEVASKLRETFGVTYDYIYEGDESGLPVRIVDQLLDAAE